MPTSDLASPDASRVLVPRLREWCAPALGREVGAIELLCGRKSVADDPTKWLVRDLAGLPAGVIKCASPAAPDFVQSEVAIISDVKERLGPELGKPVIDVLASGRVGGSSVMLMPYHRPLSGHRVVWPVQRRRVRTRLLAWLRRVVAASVADARGDEISRDFLVPLSNVERDPALSTPLRAAARLALRELESLRWVPRYALYHNDLWKENILVTPRASESKTGAYFGFAVIDWPGARFRGHAIYDLVRVAESMKLSMRALRDELSFHCQCLGCPDTMAVAYLLAAMGYLGMTLGEFPRHQYVASMERCYLLLSRAATA